jgi:hypothetical protein
LHADDPVDFVKKKAASKAKMCQQMTAAARGNSISMNAHT